MDAEQEETHILTSDCIITEIGRCEAGTMLNERDVLPSTWQWLLDRNFLKSIKQIEEEADSEADDPEGSESEQSSDQTDSEATGADESPETKPATGRRRK